MTNKKTLIIDCDGVLYPISNIPTADIVSAVEVVAKEFNISEEKYKQTSEKTKREKAPGLVNFVYNLCNKDDEKVKAFNKRMTEVIDYSKIKRDDNLFQLLQKTKENYNVVILTNNTRPHLEKVLEKRFDKNIVEFGIDCYDISSQKYKDKFYPKQSELGMKLFTKKLGLKPQECILVEDTKRNLEVAAEVGIEGVLITEDYTLSKYLLSLQNPNKTYKNENTL